MPAVIAGGQGRDGVGRSYFEGMGRDIVVLLGHSRPTVFDQVLSGICFPSSSRRLTDPLLLLLLLLLLRRCCCYWWWWWFLLMLMLPLPAVLDNSHWNTQTEHRAGRESGLVLREAGAGGGGVPAQQENRPP